MKIALSLEEMSLGGGPKFVLTLGKYLLGVGHTVTVVTQRQGLWWPELTAWGLSGYCLPHKTGSSFVKRAQQMAAYWNEQDFDAIFMNVSAQNRLALCAAHFVADRTAIVFVLHGDWQELYDLSSENAAIWNCVVGVGPKVFAGAAARFSHKPTLGISNGIELPPPAQIEKRQEWGLPLRLLFVGRLIDSHKGVYRLPAILAACRKRNLPVQLTVIGDGKDRASLAQQFIEAGVADLVEMAGAQPPAAIAAAMQSHHVLLFPTNTEGMPLVVLEAQANGCVVITTNLPGITDAAIEDGVTGRLVEPGNIEQFTAEIEAMLSPGVWKSHSQAGIERANRLFSLAVMGDHYQSLLEELERGAYPIARPFHQSPNLSLVPFRLSDYLPEFLLRLIPIRLKRKFSQVSQALRRLAFRVRRTAPR